MIYVCREELSRTNCDPQPSHQLTLSRRETHYCVVQFCNLLIRDYWRKINSLSITTDKKNEEWNLIEADNTLMSDWIMLNISLYIRFRIIKDFERMFFFILIVVCWSWTWEYCHFNTGNQETFIQDFVEVLKISSQNY